MTKNVPTTNLDIFGQAAAADPWPLLREIRDLGPVAWHEGYGRWLVSTDLAVRTVLGDFRRFKVEGTYEATLFGSEAFISTDDKPRHDGMRLVWAEPFRRPGAERLRTEITQIVDRLLDEAVARVKDGEAAELSAGICRVLPTAVICLLMGVPDEMMAKIMRWSDEMASGPSRLRTPEEVAAAQRVQDAAKTALADYLNEQIALRRAHPSDDLISGLVNSPVGKQLSAAALMQNVRQLLFGGNETSSKWLANIVVAVAESPDLQRELAADRSLIPAANDEVMRLQGVVGLTPRKASGTVEIGGVELPDGADIDCLLTSAGRDPARYENPDRFDIHRPYLPNLGFGAGLHNCLGINLAKLEAEIMVNRMLDRLPQITLTEPYAYSSISMRGASPVVIGRASGG